MSVRSCMHVTAVELAKLIKVPWETQDLFRRIQEARKENANQNALKKHDEL